MSKDKKIIIAGLAVLLVLFIGYCLFSNKDEKNSHPQNHPQNHPQTHPQNMHQYNYPPQPRQPQPQPQRPAHPQVREDIQNYELVEEEEEQVPPYDQISAPSGQMNPRQDMPQGRPEPSNLIKAYSETGDYELLGQ